MDAQDRYLAACALLEESLYSLQIIHDFLLVCPREISVSPAKLDEDIIEPILDKLRKANDIFDSEASSFKTKRESCHQLSYDEIMEKMSFGFYDSQEKGN